MARYVGYFDGTILDYKFAGLKTYTYYTLHYIATNEDPRFFLANTAIVKKTSKVMQQGIVVDTSNLGSRSHYVRMAILILGMIGLYSQLESN